MIIGSRQRLSVQNEDVEIRIDGQISKKVEHTKSLGVTIDAQLTWQCKHVEEICKKVSSAVGALKRVRPLSSERNCNSNLKRSDCAIFRRLQPGLGLFEDL